jgi:acetyl-CoA C-acetyltransferase
MIGLISTALGIARADLDPWRARSPARAVAAIEGGLLPVEIAAVEIEGRKGTTTVDTDEGPRRDTSLEKLRALRPLVKEHPSHTAGNSPGVNDGGAALVIASEEYAEKHDLKPLARFRSIAYTANRHDSLAKVPALAARMALDKAGVSVDDVDRFEVNEAFASVALQSSRDLGADPEKVNLQGGAIALGHPVGASGARLLTTLLYQLRRQGGGIGVAAICSGGGQGDAVVLEVFGE